MKLKKLFAGIVAVAMMATMAMPSFAAGTVKKSETVDATDKTVNITVKYQGSGFGSDKIKLELDSTDQGKPYAIKNSSIKNVTEVASKTIKVSTTETQVNEATAPTETTATLTVTLPDYENVGTYFYKLKQAEGATAGMTYDTDQLYLMVNVVNEKEDLCTNKFEYKVALFRNVDPTTYTTENALGEAKIENLTNMYNKGDFTATKKVKGSMADRNDTFSFEAKFTKAKDLNVNGNITMAKNDGTATALIDLAWDIENTDGTVSATKKFELSHNDKVKFENIPVGVTITVYEMDGTKQLNEGDDVGTYKVSYDQNTTLTVTKELATKSTIITNTSQVHPNTGVILDNAPYIALLTIVAAGAVFMVIKKRRNYED